MTCLTFYFEDAEQGSVWIDDLKMGVDQYWQPGTVIDSSTIGSAQNKGEDASKNASDQSKEDTDNTKDSTLKIIISIVAAVVLAAAAVAGGLVAKKRKNAQKATQELLEEDRTE